MTTPRTYYNELDKFCCDWLSNLMDAGLITPGVIDDRSIVDVSPDDIAGFERCHFFAGVGTWDFVLNIAGWRRPAWTGSCPCQPFSIAGKQLGFDDPRHLWPAWHRLIQKCRPSTIFGEQTARASAWLNLVRSDLEEMGYAVGTMPIEAASAGADHFRDRYWFVADVYGGGGKAVEPPAALARYRSSAGSEISADQHCSLVHRPCFGWGEGWSEHEFRSRGFAAAVANIDNSYYLECPDGKWRRLPPPRVRWLGARIPARVAKLRAIGNAIDWRPAAEFIAAFAECRP